jgi:hypothetical protein
MVNQGKYRDQEFVEIVQDPAITDGSFVDSFQEVSGHGTYG